MGEAKRKKETQITNGKAPSLPGASPFRGLIISPPMAITGNRLEVKSASIDSQELRASLLYWDKLLWPSSRAIYIESGPNENFLEDAGILSRPDYTMNGDMAAGVAAGYVRAFQDMDARVPGCWSMAHGEKSLILKSYPMPAAAGTSIELYRAIPVPDKEVPLEEILKFKQKRRDELVSLRLHMDEFVSSLSVSSDREMELERRLSQIDEVCGDVLRICGEWQFPVRLSSYKANVELRPFVTAAGAVAGFISAQQLAMPISSQLIAALMGAGVATAPVFKISADVGWQGLKKPSRLRTY